MSWLDELDMFLERYGVWIVGGLGGGLWLWVMVAACRGMMG